MSTRLSEWAKRVTNATLVAFHEKSPLPIGWNGVMEAAAQAVLEREVREFVLAASPGFAHRHIMERYFDEPATPPPQATGEAEKCGKCGRHQFGWITRTEYGCLGCWQDAAKPPSTVESTDKTKGPCPKDVECVHAGGHEGDCWHPRTPPTPTCEAWCGRYVGPMHFRKQLPYTPDATAFCTPACRDAGRSLHPRAP